LANAWDILREMAISAMLGIKFGPAPDAPGMRHWYDILGACLDVAGAAATVGLGISLLKRRAIWGMWVVTTILMMIVALPLERYFLQVLPLLVFAWWRGLRWLNYRLPRPAGNIVFALLLALGICPNAGHVFGIVVEQRRVPFLASYREGKCLPLIAAAKRIAQTPADAVVLAPDKTARFLTYLSGRNVFESNETPELDWPPAGHRVFVLEDGNDVGLAQWVESLGIKGTREAANGTSAEMGVFELRRVPRGVGP
jgi:hypothetical protein